MQFFSCYCDVKGVLSQASYYVLVKAVQGFDIKYIIIIIIIIIIITIIIIIIMIIILLLLIIIIIIIIVIIIIIIAVYSQIQVKRSVPTIIYIYIIALTGKIIFLFVLQETNIK